MGNEKTWRRIMDIISRYEFPVIVVSATSHTTRQLVKAAELAVSDLDNSLEIVRQINQRHKNIVSNFMDQYPDRNTSDLYNNCSKWIDDLTVELTESLKSIAESKIVSPFQTDKISSFGERLSSYLFTQCGQLYGLNLCWQDARTVIRTDSQFGSANPIIREIEQASQKLTELIEDGQLPVMGGFYGEDRKGNLTTLGFEGSDYTASLLGAALNASAIEIWTDVSGIYTCDPRYVPDARPVEELSFTEATELAYFGAKVLHPSTMKPASKKQIPIRVKNIFEPEHPGTLIHARAHSTILAKALTFLTGVTVLSINSSDSVKGYQFLADIFSELNYLHLPIDVVTTTEASVSIALESPLVSTAMIEKLEKLGNVTKIPQRGVLSLIGCNFDQTDIISAKILSPLSGIEIEMISYSKTKGNLNIVIPENKLIDAVKKVHKKIFGTP